MSRHDASIHRDGEIWQSVRMPLDLMERVREFNRATGVPRSWLIREGIQLALARYTAAGVLPTGQENNPKTS